MMREFEIDVCPFVGARPDDPASIAIGSNETIFTRLLRQGDNVAVDHLKAPPGQLAFWFTDNWWRLRYECVPALGPTPEWRLAHELAALASYAWPCLSIW